MHQIAERVVVLRQGSVVEIGPVAEVFATPRADYTRRLLDAVPTPDPACRASSPDAPELLRLGCNSHTAARNVFRIFDDEKRRWRVAVRNSNGAQCIREYTSNVYGMIGRNTVQYSESGAGKNRRGAGCAQTGRRSVQDPAARFRSVLSGSALFRAAPFRALVLTLLFHPVAIAQRAGSVHALLALLLLLPLHLLGHFLRRLLRLFSHLHSVLSEVIWIRLTTPQ
ncbi:hypothetical protein [Nocardia sp. CA-119907]|uniref:hypothetical protein n=1 Tax=Nocardia sp. CA-119907 TaxID=3239973 RepID=UPI003D98DB23